MDPAKRKLYIIAAVAFIILIAGIYFLFIRQAGPKEIEIQESLGEVKELSEIELGERPYVTLTPTADGAEIIISIENMSAFDRIEYELTYLADNPQAAGEKITRGATGTDINTKDAKYKKSLLLGTASRGVRSPDKGITDGKLTMHLFVEETEYLSETDWNLVQLGTITSALTDLKSDFLLGVAGLSKDYWAILADTVGLPPDAKDVDPLNVILPVYGAFAVAPKFSQADLSITLKENANSPVLYAYSNADFSWQKLPSNYNQSTKTLKAKVNSFATFVVVSSE